MKIRTDFVYPPIPIRQFDWSATLDGYEPGAPIGYGATEAEAIADLCEQMEDDDGPPECFGGCGRECDHPEEVEPDGSWTCPACERESAMEALADERSGR